jgi:putative permease
MTRVAKVTALIAGTLFCLAALWELSGPLCVFLISLVVAAAARSPVDGLILRGMPKPIALAAVYFVALLALTVIFVVVLYRMNSELSHVREDFQKLGEYGWSHWPLLPRIEEAFNQRLPPVEDLAAALVGNHGELLARLVMGTAFGLLGAVIDTLFVIVLSIYWTIDREYFEKLWFSVLPLPYRFSARDLWRVLETELGAYARSEIAQCLLAGLLLGTGYGLLGLNYPATLALVAAISWLVPWLGVLIALCVLGVCELPVLVLEWPRSLLPVGAAACFTMIVFAVLEFLVEPRLFNRRRYNSLFIVLAVMALAQTCGVMGLLLGPIAAVAIQASVEHFERQRLAAEPLSDLSDLAGRLADIRANTPAEVPREWLSLLDRLSYLVALTKDNLDQTAVVAREPDA